MLDTNILSDLVRHPQGKIAEKIAEVGESAIVTSIIVASELRYGAEKRQSAKLTKQIEAILSALVILPLQAPADRYYGEVRAQLAKQGTPIGPNDLLIAAHALAEKCTLVTANTSEFTRVKGLPVHNWLMS